MKTGLSMLALLFAAGPAVVTAQSSGGGGSGGGGGTGGGGTGPTNPSIPLTPATSVQCVNYDSTPVPIQAKPALAIPADIAIDAGGDIFVVDTGHRTLVRIDGPTATSNTLLGPEHLQIPVGLTISPTHGDLYIGDENTSTIWHLPCQTRNANPCPRYYSTPSNITLPQQVHPRGLQIDANDHLYIADYNGHRVWKRDVSTATLTPLITTSNMKDLGTGGFSPIDVAVDPVFHEVLVTDTANDAVWSLKCSVVNKNGLACDKYQGTAYKLPLEGSASNIATPSGVATDLQGTLFVTGKQNGIVAEIKGNKSVDLLQEGVPGYLKDPVALAYDIRADNKSLYITDDPTGKGDSSQGLYRLNCNQFSCVSLTSAYIPHLADGECAGYAVGSSCGIKCAPGYTPNVSSVACTTEGWASQNVACISDAATTTVPGNTPQTGDAGVAVGITLAVLIVLGVAVFLVIRYRQGRLLVKTSGGATYSSSFGV